MLYFTDTPTQMSPCQRPKSKKKKGEEGEEEEERKANQKQKEGLKSRGKQNFCLTIEIKLIFT